MNKLAPCLTVRLKAIPICSQPEYPLNEQLSIPDQIFVVSMKNGMVLCHSYH